MDKLLISEYPHRRLNILTGEWILVSPHRAKRPWQGQVERIVEGKALQYDPSCYLCPVNKRANGEKNPNYTSTFTFTNDFSALLKDSPSKDFQIDDLLIARGERGICRVVCFSPQHDLSLAEMSLDAILRVVEVWTDEYATIGELPFINHIQIFENKGAVMGCSNPHPHCQIWAQESIPAEPTKEFGRMIEYQKNKHSCLICDYLSIELREKERLVIENSGFAALVPFWAVWPFETIVLPKRHIGSLSEMTHKEMESFAEIIKRLTTRYDNLFNMSFPYSSGIHQAPTDQKDHPECHLHMHFYPPLLRSATVKKFMVGYEMMANPQRDITAELSAEKLRSLPEIHYKTNPTKS
jgi:UDPglucose--hexose-1-phosphate uridylyltransferase